MTVTYSLDVANIRFCGFTKLLLRWKGSIYKILWKELLCFSIGYSVLSVLYRCVLNEKQRRTFEDVAIYCETFVDLIPLSFVLGFYVSLVVGRWWNQYDAIPWPDRTCYKIATFVHGSDERSRMIRRTLGRYLILLQTLTFQAVSTAVKKRFPTADHVHASGLMTKEEKTIYEKIDVPYGKWWLPAHWFCALAMRARKEGRIKDSILLEGLIQEMLSYRSACGTMFNYDWISVPLVYTQVVTLATYSYSIALLMGRQYLDPAQKKGEIDLYVPIFTLLQLFFYVGWLKVAEQIVNPYGEDDDDFELNWCLDRSAQVVYLLVDHLHTKHPKLRKDLFWDEFEPQLPHTKLTINNIKNPQLGSAYDMEFDPAKTDFLPLETLLEEEFSEDHVYNSDSDKHAKNYHHRPSVLLQMISASLRQSVRRRSTRKGDSFRSTAKKHSNNSSSIRGHVNPVFGINNLEKTAQNSPCLSRSSSVTVKNSPVPSRSSSATVKNSPVPSRSSFSRSHSAYSPSNSRNSSLSFRPPSVGKHRHRLYDLQLQQMEGAIISGVLPDLNSGGVTPISATPTAVSPASGTEAPAFPSPQLSSQSIKEDGLSTEAEQGQPKVMESFMPPIPEEPSRPASTPDLEDAFIPESTTDLEEEEEEPFRPDSTPDADAAQAQNSTTQQSLDSVQELVAEASKVLKELNRAVSQRGHKYDCGTRGYESCCSMSSDSTDDGDTDVEEEEEEEFEEAKEQLSVIIDMNLDSKPELPPSEKRQS